MVKYAILIKSENLIKLYKTSEFEVIYSSIER